MNQLYFLGPGRLEWREIPEPTLQSPTDALVRPITVATCDLDTALIHGDSFFEGPFPLGHEGVCEVMDIGDEVTSALVGDLVIVPFQISCGHCERCQRGLTAAVAQLDWAPCTDLSPSAGRGADS